MKLHKIRGFLRGLLLEGGAMKRRLTLGSVARCAATSVTMVLAGGVFAATVTYTGGDATDATDWFAPDNWGGATPAAGDDVVVPSGFSPVLSNSTPQYASVSVGGTIVFTNWTTRLNATTVTIPSGGILTCAGPFTDTEMSNRVWVACTDFTLASGGKVNVTDKGYGKPTTVAIGASSAWGPGKALAVTRGGAHGGYGGGGWSGDGTIYGSVDEPEAPGSTGRTLNGTKWATGVPAGGAVRIDATGIVTINGAITANGHVSAGSNNSGAGSGGSVLIHANKIVASGGSINADGGRAGRGDYNTAPAGGGRIALHYDTDAQSASDLASLSISAAGGRHYITRTSSGSLQPIAAADYKDSADIGTIWFSDVKPLKFLGTSLTGQIYLGSGASYSCDSITMTSGWVRFAQEGFALSVAGDVTVSGTGARLEIGGGIYYRDYSSWWYSQSVAWIGSYHHLRSGSTPWTFTVGGDMTVTGGARLDLYAAATNGTEAAGGTLAVAGDLTIAADSKLYLSCDAMNGGAPLVKADNVSIADGAIVSANYRGFARAYGPSKSRSAASNTQTANANAVIGAGHGGAGNKVSASNGQPFDDATRPSLPGAGGEYMWEGGDVPLSGGGVVHLVAANAMTVNGTVSANAYTNMSVASSLYGRFAGASGGTVLLEAKTFAMGSMATVIADGSSVKSASATFYNAGCGGGGRIAVYTGAPYVEGETKASRLAVTDVQPTGLLGSFRVAGGLFIDKNGYGRKYVAAGDKIGVVIEGGVEVDHGEETSESATWYVCPLSEATVRGGDGTIRFVTVKSRPGLTIFVQ